MAEICKKCNSEVRQNYCPKCGTPVVLNRINQHYVLKEIGSVLNFDKGILFTIKELLFRPGKNIKAFIDEDRNRLVKPLIFILVTSLIYMIAQRFLHFEDGYLNTEEVKDSATLTLIEWIRNNYGYTNILMAIFIAGWIKLLFKSYDYNFFEILILMCFVMGIGMLIYTVFGVVDSIIKISVLHFASIFIFIYISWAIGQFFDKSKKSAYLKGFLSYFLGLLSFMLITIALGMFIDFMMDL